MGRIDGCRTLSHLEDCETFKCPPGYAKCPNSFCVAIKHICDGEKNCPGGHDENNCWCQQNRTEVVIVFHTKDIDVNTRIAIYNLARQFYVSFEKVRVLQLSIVHGTTDVPVESNDIVVVDEIINSNHELLKRYHTKNYTVQSKDLMNYIRDSFTNKSVTNSIILMQNSMSLVDFFQSVEEDTFVTLYYLIDFDENISKKAETTKESGITKIKIRKYGTSVTIYPFLFKQMCKEPDYTTCKHMYKCTSSRVCIHLSQVCDDELHCPFGDDEYNCQFKCPIKCTCKGLLIDCRNVQFRTSDYVTISRESRALDLSYNIDVHSVSFEKDMQYLYRLNISNSGLQVVDRSSFSKLRNLKILDISYNKLKIIPIDTFKDFKALKVLYLSGNTMLTTIQKGAFNGLTEIRSLTITGTRLHTIVSGTFAGLQLSKLDLSSNQISSIEDMAFNSLEVEKIDINLNDITNFNKDMFTGIRGLWLINSRAYKFCCIRPSTVKESDCHPYKDAFSSCDDLMRNNALQALLWVIGMFALLGNGASLAYRFIHDRQRLKLGYGIFVTNLSVADFIMGIYLLIIAVADTFYRNRYIWNDEYWRNSIWCNIAGVLSTIASEASVMFVCLITIDRFLVVKFPFGQNRFKTKSAIYFSIISWVLVILIAVIPLIHTDYFQNQFYTKAGVCIALPLTHDRPPGWQYSVAIFIGFNFVTFLLIAISQWLIYNEINRSRKRVTNQSKSRGNDLKIARNLLLVVTTDFLCWFPIGCMGLMALNGHVISGDVYAWAAVFILPINSAINPFLYTLSAVLNKQKFQPSIDEQSRTSTMGSKYYGKATMTTWNSRILRSPKMSYAVNSTPLADYIEYNNVTTRDVLTIGVQIASAMRYLHMCELVLGNIDINNVIAITLIDSQVIDHVQLQMKPTFCTDNIQKTEDMYWFGVIIRALLNKKNKEHI